MQLNDALVVDVERRFSGLSRLFGTEPASRLKNSHIVIVGVGGVGSWSVEALARSGIGKLTLIDMDHIAESNINRQLHALTSSIGMAKIETMRQRVQEINPYCNVVCIDDFVTADNWPVLLGDVPDGVIDACDDIAAKTTIAAWALRTKKLFVTVGAAGGKRGAHHVEIADLSLVTHDPLLARLRYQLRKSFAAPKNGKRIGLACVFSKEAVQSPVDSCASTGDGGLNCQGYGSMVSVTATFGMCAAGWMLDKLSSLNYQGHQKTL